MKFFKILMAFGFLSLVGELYSQQPHPETTPGGCGYRGHSEWLNWYRQNREQWLNDTDRGADTSWLYVPVTVHIVGTDAGLGYFPVESAVRAICQMNNQYKPAFIRFYLHPDEPFLYHNNSSWFEHDWDGGEEMIFSNNTKDRLNAFVVADPAGNCGYSWHDAIVLGKNCSGAGNSTWAHEAGHHLSLPHPFLGWEGSNFEPGAPAPHFLDWAEVEKLDGSNCHDAGDFFCDTRPDYLSYRWQCDGNRESIVTLTDPDGKDFKSDATIIMGYSYDACATRFTEEQIQAMRANLQTEHAAYLQTSVEGPMIDDNARTVLKSPLDTQQVQYNKIAFKWDPVPNATIYILEVSIVPNFQFLVATRTIMDGSTSITVNNHIPNNRLVYWRVKAYGNWDVCQSKDNLQVGVLKTVNLSATSDLERVASVELLPNPVTPASNAQLLIETTESLDGSLSINDASGRLIKKQPLRIDFGSNNIPIETSELASGLYFVILETPKGTVIKRLSVIE